MMEALEVGDSVLTTSGFYGVVWIKLMKLRSLLNFFCFQKVSDVSSAVTSASWTLASFFDWAMIKFIFFVEHV